MAANYARAGHCMNGNFTYVYVLVSLSHPDRHYTGWTEDLHGRLEAHNGGRCPHTAKFIPWQIETAIAFQSREKAIAFEKYLKSHSGRAFASKHF
ncbi:MAG TPA: GIY-YIG nuclease family protein [Phycisphaerae bacterium]|jgi:predicted GIY-YIG superfamily endonuclease|nr:GIY-YIG nuclease family protein [Phycisphaerae bacterium]